jgi:hypothetical protein
MHTPTTEDARMNNEHMTMQEVASNTWRLQDSKNPTNVHRYEGSVFQQQ